MKISKKIAVSNLIWRFGERCGVQIVTFLVTIILALLLEPSDFGIVVNMSIVLNILGVFVDGGFSTALIQKKNADETDFSSVFWGQLFACGFLYIVLFVISPVIANFFGNIELTSMIRVLGISLIVSSVKNVQVAYVTRNMIFRKFFFATIGGTLCSAIIGVIIAYLGGGPWAIIAQSLFNTTIDTIILWFIVKWRPQKKISLKRIKELFSYGWKLLLSSLLDALYNNIRALLIGKIYSSEDLAYYDHGDKWPNAIINSINSSIDSILFPSMSSEQENLENVKLITQKSIKTVSYIIFPLLIGIAFCGESLIKFCVTDKWLPALPFLVILCFYYALYPLHTANLNAIKSIGRSDVYLKVEVFKKLFGFISIICSLKFGPLAICLSVLLSGIFSLVVNILPNKKLINYGLFEQFKDVLPNLLLSIFMGFVIFWFKYLTIPVAFIVILQLLTGFVIFIMGSLLFKLESLYFILDIIKSWKCNNQTNN